MRTVYLIVALLISFHSFAQNGFAKQFRDIVNDTANGFPNFRGEETMKGELTTRTKYAGYISLITLENTSKNNIHYMSGSMLSVYSYDVLIADSVKEADGKKICDELKDKVALITGPGYVIKKYERVPLLGKYGWNFFKGELNISIDLSPIETTELNRVGLSIAYTIYKVR